MNLLLQLLKIRSHVVLQGIILICVTFNASALEELLPITNWEEIASGVWKVQIGNAEKELSYTSLAARSPRIEELNKKAKISFPFQNKAIKYHQSEDLRIQVRIPTDVQESIYGFGLQLDGIKKSKKVLTLNVDHWSRGGGRTHAPVPFYISSKGYGVLFNTARFLKVYVQNGNHKDSPNNPAPVDRNPPPEESTSQRWSAMPDSDAVEAHLCAHGLEIMVFAGENLQDIVSRYNLYCGGGAMPPLWGLGFWHRTRSTHDAELVEEEVDEYVEQDIPLDVIGLEPGWMTRSYPCTYEWQKLRFPDPKQFSSQMSQKGIHLNLWENPYISPEGKLYEKLYPLSGSHLVWLGLVPDYTLPEAREILCKQHTEDHLSIGISGYKIDEVDGYDRWLWPDHAIFPSGTSGETMRQAYGMIMQQMLYKNLFHKHNYRTYSLVRSSNAGASGMPFVLYSDSYHHRQYITGISAASLGGLLWTPEVRNARSPEEWRARTQTVCFSPMAQLNAWSSGKKPWDFGSVTNDIKEAIRLRMRLLPYLYTAFAEYNRKGIPPFRAMVLEQGVISSDSLKSSGKVDDVKNPYGECVELEQDDQYMFGPSILVAPYYEKQTLERDVKLPQGNWYDFYTGNFAGNGETIKVNTPERIPLFVKDGAVIPMLTKHVNNTNDAYGHALEVRHYGKKAGSFELYEDDAKTFDYEKGEFGLRLLKVKNGKGSISVIKKGSALFGDVELWNEMTK